MFLKEMQIKGIFRTRINLAEAFNADPEKSVGVKNARREIELAKLNIQTLPDDVDAEKRDQAQEKLKTWEAVLADTLETLASENDRLKDYAEIYAGEWILMREPRQEELLKFGTGEKDKAVAQYADLFPACMVDWSIKSDESNKASAEEVLALIKESSTLYSHCLLAWGTSLPLARRSARA